MKIAKLLLPLVLVLAVFVAGCSKDAGTADKEESSGEKDMIPYQSETGPVEVPANPERVVVLGMYAGNVLSLGVDIVGVDQYAKANPHFEAELKDVPVVTEDDLEEIVALEPDLIIGLSNMKNIDKLQEIAPTVTYTYGKLDYIEQHIEIGQLLGKEDEATKWAEEFQAEAKATGEEVRAEIGEDATVSVFENADKQLYLYGDGWARGTDVLYQEMGLQMPATVQEATEKDGYFAVSSEVMPEYMGDYVILSMNSDYDSSFMETETYKNTPAVQDDHVLKVDAKKVFFNDPRTLEYELGTFKAFFLGE